MKSFQIIKSSSYNYINKPCTVFVLSYQGRVLILNTINFNPNDFKVVNQSLEVYVEIIVKKEEYLDKSGQKKIGLHIYKNSI